MPETSHYGRRHTVVTVLDILHWIRVSIFLKLKSKLKPNKALDENSSLSYEASPAMQDHTVLPATRHKWTCPACTPASKLVLDLPTSEGWKAELATRKCTNWESNSRSISGSQVRRTNHYTTEPYRPLKRPVYVTLGTDHSCCAIAIGLRPSLYRRKPLVHLCYFYRSVFGSF